MRAVEIPLSSYADAMLVRLARTTGVSAIAALDGRTLLGERAMLAQSSIPDRISAGGGCRFFAALDDTVALNLARAEDRDLLPALFETDALDSHDDLAIAAQIARCPALPLVLRGRSMGLALAAEHESMPTPIAPCVELTRGTTTHPHTGAALRVVDLSALWAGPLASHLLWLAGAEVIKVESRSRPDAMRAAREFYALLNQGKDSVVFDFNNTDDLRALETMIASADIVIEAARPRALAQLGVDASRLVRNHGLIWIAITAHGAQGDAANWVGFGDDCGVAGGLSAALRAACGETGFVGDAIADPLTGILAALTAWTAWAEQRSAHIGIAMSHVVAHAVSQSQTEAGSFATSLRAWHAARGQPFPTVQRRTIGAVARFGEHTERHRLAQLHSRSSA